MRVRQPDLLRREPRRPGRRPRLCRSPQDVIAWSSACACVGALALLAAPAQAANKPDLVIKSPKGLGNEYAFQGRTGNAAFTFTTKNEGKARAGASVTRVQLDHADRQFGLGQAPVPRLTPGGKTTDAVPGVDDPDLRFDQPLGAYVPEVCADATDQVRESDEHNNCEFVTEPARFRHFYVAKRTWDGTLFGNSLLAGGFGGNVRERWRSEDAGFDFSNYLGDGAFEYEFQGTVKWTDAGTDAAGCRWSGEGTRVFGPGRAKPTGRMKIDYLKENYSGGSAADTSFYKIQQRCSGGGGSSLPGPGIATFWTSAAGTASPLRPFPFGSSAISDTAGGPGGEFWSWSLR